MTTRIRHFLWARRYLQAECPPAFGGPLSEFESGEGLRINGVYDFVNEDLLAIYVHDRELFFQFKNSCWPISLGLKASCGSTDDGDFLRVYGSQGEVVCAIDYTVGVEASDLDQPFYSAEKSDFDIGRLICDVISSSALQRDRLLVWSDAK